jgi:hypothetical protein
MGVPGAGAAAGRRLAELARRNLLMWWDDLAIPTRAAGRIWVVH